LKISWHKEFALVYTSLAFLPIPAWAQNGTDLATSIYAGGLGTWRQRVDGNSFQSARDHATEVRANSRLRLRAPTTTRTISLQAEQVLNSQGLAINERGSAGFDTQTNDERSQYGAGLVLTDRRFNSEAAELNLQDLRQVNRGYFNQSTVEADVRGLYQWDLLNSTGSTIRARRRFQDADGRDQDASLFHRYRYSRTSTLELRTSFEMSHTETTQYAALLATSIQNELSQTARLEVNAGAGALFDESQGRNRPFFSLGGVANWITREFQNRASAQHGISTLALTGTLAQTDEIRFQSRYIGFFDHAVTFEGAFRYDRSFFSQESSSNSRTEIILSHEWAFGNAIAAPIQSRPVALLSSVTTSWDRSVAQFRAQILRVGVLAQF
jgi:hypothetical protein